MTEDDETSRDRAGRHEAPTDRDRQGHVRMPADTGPNPEAMPGTSEQAEPVQGVYRPDVGPGGRDIDTGDRPVPGRDRAARGPHSDDAER